MAIGRTNAGGAGGASLNFKVVPGLTQPGAAAENTIWVKTERLTGWYFAATQPENMQEGEVWFPTGTESAVEFNALKKNGIQVYPLSAKQLTGGVLVDVEAMSYQGGEWNGWITYLYNAGDECESITGGWSADGYSYNNGATVKAGTLGISSMTLDRSADDSIHVLGTSDMIDLTNKNTLYIEVTEVTKITAWPNVTVSRTKTNWADDGYFILQHSLTATGVIATDISSISSGYISVVCNAGRGKVTVKDIWMV